MFQNFLQNLKNKLPFFSTDQATQAESGSGSVGAIVQHRDLANNGALASDRTLVNDSMLASDGTLVNDGVLANPNLASTKLGFASSKVNSNLSLLNYNAQAFKHKTSKYQELMAQANCTSYKLVNKIITNSLSWPDIVKDLEADLDLKVGADNLIRSVLLEDEFGYVLAIVRAVDLLDFVVICNHLGRPSLQTITPEATPDWLREQAQNNYLAELSTYLPLAAAWQGVSRLTILIDQEIVTYLEADSNNLVGFIIALGGATPTMTISTLSGSEFLAANPKYLCGQFTCEPVLPVKPVTQTSAGSDLDPSEAATLIATTQSAINVASISLEQINDISRVLTPKSIQKKLIQIDELPMMPNIAEDLLQLRVDPAASSGKLAKIIERDPALAAKLLGWASSPYYKYPGKIHSIEDSIVKVMGYDLVMNIAVGIVIGQVMFVQEQGPLGFRNYWRHSLATATLVQALVEYIPIGLRPVPGLAYLAGLLHNIGHLFLGQIFPAQFELLNNSWQANKNYDLVCLETTLFQMDHQLVGSWLVSHWNLPAELQHVVQYHHHVAYRGESEIYVHLVYLANCLLARLGLGDQMISSSFETSLEVLQLQPKQVEQVWQQFVENLAEIEETSKCFGADNTGG